MRKGMFLLSLLLLASTLQAQLNITAFVTPYLYKGENYSRDVRVVNASIPSGNYSIVVINNTYTFLLNLSDRIYFVEDRGQVDSILREYYRLSTYPTKAELDAINSSFQSFLSSRALESECMVLTGLTDPDGSPRFTCTADNICESCQSVPVCRDVMHGTQETADPMSSTLVKSIVKMSTNLLIINGNLSKFNDNMANLNSSDISQPLTAIKESLTAIKAAVDDMGKAPIRIIYEQYTDYHNPKALGFCRNFYAPYNLTALSLAINKATELSSRVPNQSMIAEQISSIYNYTPERKDNKTRREEREAFDVFYTGLLARRNNITARADEALLHIRDNSTTQKLEELDDILDAILDLGDQRDYGGANLLSRNFSRIADTLDSQISGLNTSYNELLTRNESSSEALFEAWLYLNPEDIVIRGRLDDLYTQKASVEFTIYNSSPLSLEETNKLTDELLSIELNAGAIIDEKASASSQQMNNLIAIISKPVVSVSLNFIDSVIPLSYADKEKNASTIIGILLVLADILIIVVTLAAFFLVVRSRRVELRRVAKILWAFIFTFFFLLLTLGSLAIYNVADMQSQPTTFGPFLSEFKRSTKVGVIAELTDLNGTARETISNCSARVAAKLESLQKSVMHYKFDGDNCLTTNSTQSRTSCENELDVNPVIILRSGEENKATFTVFYTKKATLQGDEKFFTECMISKVLQ